MSEYPMRKVVYTELKPGTKKTYFILLECGHFDTKTCVSRVPAKRQCGRCWYDFPFTVGRMDLEHSALLEIFRNIEWALQKRLEKEKPEIDKYADHVYWRSKKTPNYEP